MQAMCSHSVAVKVKQTRHRSLYACKLVQQLYNGWAEKQNEVLVQIPDNSWAIAPSWPLLNCSLFSVPAAEIAPSI